MNQKDYNEIAGIIKKNLIYFKHDNCIKYFSNDLADYFEKEGDNIYSENESFDKGQFLKDCGVINNEQKQMPEM